MARKQCLAYPSMAKAHLHCNKIYSYHLLHKDAGTGVGSWALLIGLGVAHCSLFAPWSHPSCNTTFLSCTELTENSSLESSSSSQALIHQSLIGQNVHLLPWPLWGLNVIRRVGVLQWLVFLAGSSTLNSELYYFYIILWEREGVHRHIDKTDLLSIENYWSF